MATFSQEHSSNYTPNVWGDTDAHSYGPNATSIVFNMGVNYPTGRYDYTLTLEYWDGNNWRQNESQNGYFSNRVTKTFYLSGKRAGSYRFRCYLWRADTNTLFINGTEAFVVRR